MLIHTTKSAGSTYLRPVGRFDFNCRVDFHDSYSAIIRDKSSNEIVLDLTEVTYVDSSALGMILTMRSKCEHQRMRVRIIGATGTVKRILEIANFDKLMSII